MFVAFGRKLGREMPHLHTSQTHAEARPNDNKMTTKGKLDFASKPNDIRNPLVFFYLSKEIGWIGVKSFLLRRFPLLKSISSRIWAEKAFDLPHTMQHTTEPTAFVSISPLSTCGDLRACLLWDRPTTPLPFSPVHMDDSPSRKRCSNLDEEEVWNWGSLSWHKHWHIFSLSSATHKHTSLYPWTWRVGL